MPPKAWDQRIEHGATPSLKEEKFSVREGTGREKISGKLMI
jgi:hypothetical protein